MKRENYQKPTMMVVQLQHSHLLAGSQQEGTAKGESFDWDTDE